MLADRYSCPSAHACALGFCFRKSKKLKCVKQQMLMAYPATLKDTRVPKQTGLTANYAASQAKISQLVLYQHLLTRPTHKGCPFHEGSTVQLQSEGTPGYKRDCREFRRLHPRCLRSERIAGGCQRQMGKILDIFNTTDGEMGNVCTGTNGSPQNLSLYFIKSSVCEVAPESIWALKTHLKCLKITELETNQIKWQLFLRKCIEKHF